MIYSTYDLHCRQREILDKAAAGEKVIIVRRGEKFEFTCVARTVGFNPMTLTVAEKYPCSIGDL